MSAKRMQAAVRMLDKAVFLLLRADEAGISALQNGRLAVELRKQVPRLKRLLRDGPEDKFWIELQKAILVAAKYLNRM